MEVILLESFDRLGQIGDIVNVKNGFARNFLIPQKKALRANKENKEKFLKIKNDLIEKNKKIVEESQLILKKIENKDIVFIRNASDNGQLYGSVSPKDIANYFNEKKIGIKPSNINLHTSIKKIGIYDLNVKLHADVGCNLKINVATSEENAKKQKLESENIAKSPNDSTMISDDNKTDQDNESSATKTEDKMSYETSKDKKTSQDTNNVDSNTNTENTNEEIKTEQIKNPEIKATE